MERLSVNTVAPQYSFSPPLLMFKIILYRAALKGHLIRLVYIQIHMYTLVYIQIHMYTRVIGTERRGLMVLTFDSELTLPT